MPIDFSYTVTRKERTRYENNYTLGVNGQGPKPGPLKKRADYPQAVNKVLVLRRQLSNPNPYIPKHLRFRQRPIVERERLEQQWRRRGWISWSQSSSSSTWWTPQEWQEKSLFFRVVERTTVNLSRSFANRQQRFPCKRRGV